ncbi:MAG: hypothetical protein R3Y58_05120 [Eubacteriales bacterium]
MNLKKYAILTAQANNIKINKKYFIFPLKFDYQERSALCRAIFEKERR